MAAIASSKSLLEGLQTIPSSQAWLDGKMGLVLGTFPQPKMKFDFLAEVFVNLEETKERVQPVRSKQKIFRAGAAKRIGEFYELETEHEIFQFGSATQALVESLEIIEDRAPGTLDKLSKMKGRTKRPVSRVRSDLYDNPHPEGHSTLLKNGFYVGTNNKSTEALDVIRRAIQIAGLERSVEIKPAR